MKRKCNDFVENNKQGKKIIIDPATTIFNAISGMAFTEVENLIAQYSSDNNSNILNAVVSGFFAIPPSEASNNWQEIENIFHTFLLRFDLNNHQALLADALITALNSENSFLANNIIAYINDINALEVALLNTTNPNVAARISNHIDNLRLNIISQNYLSDDFLRITLTNADETTKYIYLLAEKILKAKNKKEKDEYSGILKEIFYNIPDDQSFQVNLNMIEFPEPTKHIASYFLTEIEKGYNAEIETTTSPSKIEDNNNEVIQTYIPFTGCVNSHY